MTKRFYKLMCFATAAAMSIIGCGPEDDPTVEYGAPTDLDQYQTDNDEYTDATKYGVLDADYAPTDDMLPDADEPLVIPDEPAMEYGPVQTDYDDLKSDAIIEQPDEMTTDYGPISRPFVKK
ncbi:MAG TPA: hypothetical protein PKH10_02165 [bacterium]|nr:hypothetical protein [bacterium]